MSLRTTHTTTYFTCRWLVVVLAIFFFADIHVLPARAQELPEATTGTTQELDGQATTIEATQEQSGQVATTETTQESYNSQTITESGQQTNVIYDSIFDELNLDENFEDTAYDEPAEDESYEYEEDEFAGEEDSEND